MEPNGFQGSVAPAQQPQQPAQHQPQQVPQQQPVSQQPQQPVQPQPTPQFNIFPTGPDGRPQVPQQPAAQQTTQQQNEIAQLRQQIAAGLNVQLDQVPSDVASLAKIVQGGYFAANRLEQMKSQQTPAAQPVQQPQQQPGQQPDQFTPRQMYPGWERMVERAPDGTYKPVHPNFASVAADANYNEGVYAARTMAVTQGQFLPEQKASVEEIITQKLEQERESMRASLFMEANEQKLFVMNPDGTRKMEVQPDGSVAPARTELGMEMISVAQEILQSGAQFNSQHDLAKYALKVAEGRIRMKQQQNQQTEQQPQQTAHNDLAALLNSHRQSGNAGGGNINTIPAPPTNDLRTNLRAILKGAPMNGNGMDMLNYLRGR